MSGGRSCRWRLRTASRPIPGSPKTDSTKTEPPKATPTSMPSIVITGRNAFLSTCPRTTRHSEAPFARAVVT